uniref:Uncharacterized protein n=1 Tax=viral metagenome TaxID=1070528 RepID=A0A6M3L2M3_9ZZZZ
MDGWIKQSTAHTFQMGPFLDSTDGVTAEASLTIAAASVLISKHGAALAAKNDATALTGTGDSHGYYDCVLDGTDTGTVGTLKVEAQISGALPVWHTFQVLPANVYDSLVAGTDALQVHANEITNGLITAAAIADGAIDNATFAADVGSTAYATNILALAADKALVQQKLDHLIAVAESSDVVNSSVIAKMVSKSATPAFSSYDNTTDSLEGIRDTAPLGTAMRGTDSAALASVCTEGRLAELDAANLITDVANVKADTAAILLDTGTDGVVLPQAQADKVWGTAARALTDKADFALSSASRDAIWDQTGSLTISFETLVQRAYQILNNKMIVTEATGAVALRNLADLADVATGTVADLGATTQRDALAWV